MTRRLQQTDFDQSIYERPDREWICGHTGRPCALGPDVKGHCNTTHECVPAREGDRWRCTRTAPFGGECERGPLPDGSCCNPIATCQPRRNLRAKRGRTVRVVVALTVGVLAIFLGGDGALDFVHPGPVTKHHGTIEGDCVRCHAAGAGGFSHWIGMAFAETERASDSERCLECHDLGASNLLPHSLPAVELAETTARFREREIEGSAPLRVTLASLGPARSVRAGAELTCAVCHQEHQGVDHELTSLSNDQCQVCHAIQFDRFEEDHPALGLYPHGRRTRIAFDHATHIEEYFPGEEREDISCVTCHAPDATGRTMDVNEFATSCADCHDGDVRSAGSTGIAFLNLPAIDARGLRRSGIDPGQWPAIERARPPSPFIGLLLAGDSRWQSDDPAATSDAMTRADNAASLDPEERQQVGRWVWAYKSLLLELRNDGHRTIANRIASDAITADALGPGDRANLLSGIDRALVASTVDTWFPDLEREMSVFDRVTGELEDLGQMERRHWEAIGAGMRDLAGARGGRGRASSGDAKGGDRWVREGGWYRSGKDASIRYRSRGHADPFLRTWFDVAAAVAQTGDAGSEATFAANALFAGLRRESTTGSCTLCHSIDTGETEDGVAGSFNQVAWRPHRPDPHRKRATEFRHMPHFSLDNAGTCDTCHTLRESDPDAFAEAYEADASTWGHALNFEPVGRETCGDCHTREAAGDDCVACHNYHLGDTRPIHLTATLSAAEEAQEEAGDE